MKKNRLRHIGRLFPDYRVRLRGRETADSSSPFPDRRTETGQKERAEALEREVKSVRLSALVLDILPPPVL